MTPGVKINGLERVIDSLDKRTKEYKAGWQAVVGFTAPYAIYVHEDLTKHHDNGRAKFLEYAIREHAQEVRRAVAKSLKSGAKLGSAMSIGANLLLRLARQYVPVDTGFLRDSGYTEVLGARSRTE